MNVHYNVTHLQNRDHVCDVTGCGKAFGYKHLLQRHSAKIHGKHSADHDPIISNGNERGTTFPSTAPEEEIGTAGNFIEHLTGKQYKRRGEGQIISADIREEPSCSGENKIHKSRVTRRVIFCPWPNLLSLNIAPDDERTASGIAAASEGLIACEGIFHRAYDLRRHLRADHGLEVSKEELNAWLKVKG
jgi:general transcription factor IIIA